MSNKAIVLDANILIRSVLGRRVNELILTNAAMINFFAPEAAFTEAAEHLPALLKKRGATTSLIDPLETLKTVVLPLDLDFYVAMQQPALQRIAMRDADDWLVLACAMVLGCPVWTEDTDFFGTGVATWTTDRVELYFA